MAHSFVTDGEIQAQRRGLSCTALGSRGRSGNKAQLALVWSQRSGH